MAYTPGPAGAEVSSAVRSWAPECLDDRDWSPVADLVVEVVLGAAPSSVPAARRLCRDVAYLAVWTDRQHLPLRSDHLFSAGNVEAFLAALVADGVPVRSVATFAANLHGVRDSLGLPLDVVRRPFGAARVIAPYEPGEVAGIFAQGERVADAGRRRCVLSALHLLFGAGATPADLVAARPDDVFSAAAGSVGTGVWVRLGAPDRVVELRAAHGEALLGLAADCTRVGSQFLIGGAGTNKNRVPTMFAPRRKSGLGGVDLSCSRARSTWMVDVSADGSYPNVVTLVDAAGFRSLDRLEKLIPYIRARTEDLPTVPLPGTGNMPMPGVELRGGVPCRR